MTLRDKFNSLSAYRRKRIEDRAASLMEQEVVYEKTATGYSAHIRALPGCIAAGATKEETAKLMRKAIRMHMVGMREDGDPIP